MAFTKITGDDLQNKGVTGLPDTPNLSTAEMQQKFDELSLEVIIPRLNALINELEDASASGSLGAKAPEGINAENNIQAIINALSVIVRKCNEVAHKHENKGVLDEINKGLVEQINRLIEVFGNISAVSQIVNGQDNQLPSCKAISEYVQEMGGGDMTRTVYDSNRNGIVDNSEMLGGEPKEYYQPVSDNRLNTRSKNIVDAINEVNDKEVEVLDTKAEIEANTEEGKVAGAAAVKEIFGELNDKVVFPDGTGFYPDVQNGVRGYNTDPQRGADTFCPFTDRDMEILTTANQSMTYTFDKDYASIVICSGAAENGLTTKTLNGISFSMDKTYTAGGSYGMSCKILNDIKAGDTIKLVTNINVPFVIYG